MRKLHFFHCWHTIREGIARKVDNGHGSHVYMTEEARTNYYEVVEQACCRCTNKRIIGVWDWLERRRSRNDYDEIRWKGAHN